MTTKRFWTRAIFALCVLVGCGPADSADERTVPADSPAPVAVVDSALPMPVLLERFRAGLTEPERMTSGAATRDELVERIVRALEANDTAAFEPLAIDVEEFAWLYFPTTATARPPYELPPGVAWLQVQQRNRTGVLRALREYGGAQLDLRGYDCGAEPELEGVNRMWQNCVVELGRDGEQPSRIRLFGTIIERDGRFAVVSFSNDF